MYFTTSLSQVTTVRLTREDVTSAVNSQYRQRRRAVGSCSETSKDISITSSAATPAFYATLTGFN